MDKESMEILEKKIDKLIEKLLFYKEETEKLRKENSELKSIHNTTSKKIEALLKRIDEVTAENDKED